LVFLGLLFLYEFHLDGLSWPCVSSTVYRSHPKAVRRKRLKLTISLVLLVSSVSTIAWTFTKLDKLELSLAGNRSTINSYSTPKRDHFVTAVTRKT
jgi:hypothetical protein